MPYSLLLTAELQGITDLHPKDSEESPYYYTFRVQCTSCREEHANAVSFNRYDTIDIPGSRGEANFVWKCKTCTVRRIPPTTAGLEIPVAPTTFTIRTTYADPFRILQKTHSASILEAAKTFDVSNGKTQSIIELDCRGLEPIEFIADGEWLATGIDSGTKFSNIELEEGEWFDYDDKAGQEVSITDVHWEIRRA